MCIFTYITSNNSGTANTSYSLDELVTMTKRRTIATEFRQAEGLTYVLFLNAFLTNVCIVLAIPQENISGVLAAAGVVDVFVIVAHIWYSVIRVVGW
jgi:hypothetical protein